MAENQTGGVGGVGEVEAQVMRVAVTAAIDLTLGQASVMVVENTHPDQLLRTQDSVVQFLHYMAELLKDMYPDCMAEFIAEHEGEDPLAEFDPK